MALSPRDEQIRLAHAGLIRLVVQAAQNPETRAELEPVLTQAEQGGWTDLVARIRKILDGNRDPALLLGLDDEDTVIVKAILAGLQDPSTLPDPESGPDPAQAAPGLAQVIHAASRGDAQALHWLSQMAEQMTRAGGDMARIGGITKRLVDGERDPDTLCRGMGAQGESLVLSLLTELGKLERH
ncbi:hypothetical protein [Thioalkalivibrio paradoxus]|uniref:Uncharacterized protein n=1 Tax=Thioalkalivibrio paradoxus ARh 1 TaxID=713585 RepID=W0DGM4_9GAMM|nr:hypothetical protein [Thioalkalivibrio paradoxus]AHE97531.1 hypothetical protein THITH_03795 [Thioalkalivibrio paradoxus ARh 1]